ncbi:aldo/keto reductase [Aetokthonos hydrillicola Thurmond2011]|jgi:aryl-alcohol dehydrogenase-like predicted oxidoreductase|uniref:Aldo/keto reductase n=1 Tax=Aetokthonos hydrillicola Thurmond2011 TaxID=2712845 RepID=A0AAP5I3K9_9CYAN|nr:aldo/keto reductase [Aetokthonos hydrillicola]MBO3457288.1 aldo/keto reductase [Aetokthonos hydrillicola CCALA 1050]MBW4586633.1 aldo/keto reductase [Aetokthonos hydrillicola CCALA 1050]MDR9894040.1 aldo/keto reductase [Aetokthonos hydrillicola Thurmond2011]
MDLSRRNFLKTASISGLTAAGLAASESLITSGNEQSVAQTPAVSNDTRSGDMIYRTLGRTKEKVSVIGLGGHHIGRQKDEQESIRIIRSAIDRGINFMDNCWDYHNGGSEIRMGKALKDGYRQKVFLMTKIDGRTKASAAQQIDESLRRLQTDHVDLMQFHEILRLEDPDRVFAPGGAMEAMLEAQKAGKVRYIGFTGHKDPLVHLRMLEVANQNNFRFDTAQMPLNVMDAHFRSFERQVVPVLVKNQIGVLGMKSMGDQNILKSNTVKPIECLHYAMNLPTSTVITGIDSLQILDQAFEAARTYKPMSQAQVAAILQRTADAAARGRYELFKTTNNFDGTAKNPQWLG